MTSTTVYDDALRQRDVARAESGMLKAQLAQLLDEKIRMQKQVRARRTYVVQCCTDSYGHQAYMYICLFGRVLFEIQRFSILVGFIQT